MKLFTVQQARELLPALREHLQRIRAVVGEMRHACEEIASEHALEPDDPLVRKLLLDKEGFRETAQAIEADFEVLSSLGVECKSIEQGLIDFPCLLEDRVVYLCWKEDEPDIAFWHEIDTGYAGRRPLLEATRADEEDVKYLN
jgi:hypothetical protein